MKDSIVEQEEKTEMEDWVVELLGDLIPVVARSLKQRPWAVPDYVETTIQWGDKKITEVQIRVSFKEVGR